MTSERSWQRPVTGAEFCVHQVEKLALHEHGERSIVGRLLSGFGSRDMTANGSQGRFGARRAFFCWAVAARTATMLQRCS